MLIDNWTDEHTEGFGKKPMVVKHRMGESGLFTDEALIALLDKHPKSHLDVCTMGDDPIYPYRFRTGESRDVDGRTLLEAAKSGAIWMNLRQCMNMHDEYEALISEVFGNLASLSGRKPFSARGSILISSPIAKVPYHCDPRETILWHVRGHKRFIRYPRTPENLPDQAYEEILYGAKEDLPYLPEMEKSAEIFDLHDGDMISWPLNSPHRVENVTFCVSVTTEYSSFESAYKNSAMYTNAVLRQKFSRNPSWREASKAERSIKAAAGVVMRKFGGLEALEEQRIVTFKVNCDAPGYIQDTEPYVRDF